MFKLITIGVLIFILYRMVIGQPLLGGSKNPELLKDKDKEDDFVDYEELD